MDIAPGLTIDADYWAGRAAAVLGHRGVGKSTTCRVLAEELYAAKVQTLIIDPMGVFWGLRADTAGNPSGVPIPVFGGRRGDVPLEPSAGKLMADLAVERGLSMVLDLSEFDSQEQEFAFTAQFLAHLYRKNSGLVHVIVDEADQFAPQVIEYKEQRPALNAMINLVRRGRNKGIGVTMASQRAASLSKNVLSQVSILAAMRMTAPADRDSIAAWVRGQGDSQSWSKIAERLPKLAVGEAWWWIPEQEVLTQAKVRRARTFDTSPTRSRRNSVTREPKALTDVDLARIADQIAATRERAAANDPRALTARIRELEAENARLQLAATGGETRTVEVRVEVPVPYVPEKVATDLAALHQHAVASARESDQMAAALAELQAAVADVPAPRAPAAEPKASEPKGVEQEASQAARTAPAAGPGLTPSTGNGAAPDLTPARQRILDALAELASIGIPTPSRDQLGMWTPNVSSSRSGGFKNNLGALRTLGLIDYPAGGHVTLLPAGAALAAPSTEPTVDELHRRVRAVVTPAQWLILDELIRAYPTPLTRAELASRIPSTKPTPPTSGGFKNNLGALRTLGMLDYPSPGSVLATEILMLAP